VFRTDSAEDCWKLAAVKDEVVDVSIEEPDVDVEDKDDIRLEMSLPCFPTCYKFLLHKLKFSL
jgi:hypothetical protein